MNIITRLEEAILVAIWRLKNNAYGVTINKQVSESLKKNIQWEPSTLLSINSSERDMSIKL